MRKTKFAAVMLALAAACCLALPAGGAHAAASTGDGSVYFLAGEDEAFLVSAQNADRGTAGLAMSAENNARLIKTDTGSVVYAFDLDDGIERATLSAAGRYVWFSYSLTPDGTYTRLAQIEEPAQYGNHAVFFACDLTEENALSGADNKFYVKVQGGIAAYDGWLFALAVTDRDEKLEGELTLSGLDAVRYAYGYGGLLYGRPGAESDPRALSPYLGNGSKMVLRAGFSETRVESVTPSIVKHFGGTTSIARVSADGENWTAYAEGTPIPIEGDGVVWLEIVNASGGDELISQINFTAVLKPFEFNDLESQENKDFGYGADTGRQPAEPLPAPADAPAPERIDAPEWFGAGGCNGSGGTAMLALLPVALCAAIKLFGGRGR